jgi:tetratricopeptide (TPR) repeat protein
MARLDRERGRIDEAERALREAVETGRQTLGEDHPYTLIFSGYLGGVLFEQGKHQEAIALLTPIESATRERLTGSNIYRLATLLTALGSARVGLGYDAERFALAEANLLEAHSIFVDSRGEEDEETMGCTKALADLYTAWDEAEPGAGYDAKASEWRARAAAAAE